MKETVAALKKEIPGIKIMVGGAPVTQSSANKIGAEGYGKDAPSAVKLAREFI
jgi:5-methyltetrahydrofolate--homocysteine methyltransferase